MTMRMLHANVNCSDLDRSLDFYTRVLGGSVLLTSGDDGSDLSGPMGGFDGASNFRAALIYWHRQGHGPYIDLIEWTEPGDKVDRTAKDMGVARICWQVDDLDSIAADLEARGVVFNAPANVVQLGDHTIRGLFFPDPDGTLLEIVEMKATPKT